jgi:pilus assembly protein CpaE
MALPRLVPAPEAAPAFLATVVDDVTREIVRQVASQFGWPASRVREGGVAAAQELLRDAPAPTVLLVDVSDSDDILRAMDALAEVCDTHTRVVALGQANDIALYRELIRLGVSDYLVKPVTADVLADALRRASRTPAPEAAPAKPARTIALIGARGGVGATTMAVSLAWALAEEQLQRTVLLDLDMQFGAAALSLDLEIGRGLREMLTNPERIDSLLIGSAMVHAGERLRILGGEEPLEDDVDVGPQGLQALISALSESCESVVVDTPRRADRLTRELLAQAEVVGVVTDLSLPAMRDTHRLLTLLKGLRPQGETLVIANRVGGVAGEAPQAEFERGIGARLDALIPYDAKAAVACAEQAKPLIATSKGSPAGAELRRLVAQLAGGAPVAEPAAERPSWLKRIVGR